MNQKGHFVNDIVDVCTELFGREDRGLRAGESGGGLEQGRPRPQGYGSGGRGYRVLTRYTVYTVGLFGSTIYTKLKISIYIYINTILYM